MKLTVQIIFGCNLGSDNSTAFHKVNDFPNESKYISTGLFEGRAILFMILIFSLIGSAFASEQKIYETDSYGRIQYHKPSFTIFSDGRIIETDTVGNKQHHKQQYLIKGNRVYPTDSIGNIQHYKPSLQLEK